MYLMLIINVCVSTYCFWHYP